MSEASLTVVCLGPASAGRAVGRVTPEFQKPLPVNSGVPGACGGRDGIWGLKASAVKQGPKTAGFSCPLFVTTGGWSERSPFTPKVTVWMSFDDRLSNVIESPGRTESVFGK